MPNFKNVLCKVSLVCAIALLGLAAGCSKPSEPKAGATGPCGPPRQPDVVDAEADDTRAAVEDTQQEPTTA